MGTSPTCGTYSSAAIQLFIINLKSIGGLIFTHGFTPTPRATQRAIIKAGNPKELFTL